ncbi:MAG: carboxy-S-adenosyl-L-methionine synthase CmoA [Pseudomonadota bacterium]|nr:carboxy-S-adenosyl-L-methionine synthase CmoA [Pseudomonadota bacterium]
MSSFNKDSLYAQPVSDLAPFAFDGKVAAVFTDMIQRSVPGYALSLQLIGICADRYVQAGSRVYDLGCSLGAASQAVRAGTTTPHQLIAIDQSPEMVTACREHLQATAESPVELQCADVRDVPIEDASLVILNFTLQFIPPTDRAHLLTRVYHGLRPGGVLVLSEKIQAPTEHQDQRWIDLHHRFKRLQGYSALEISQKRAALDAVLIPETAAQHQTRLNDLGFASVDPILQCLNFCTLLAVK